jgi:hypothetical protein
MNRVSHDGRVRNVLHSHSKDTNQYRTRLETLQKQHNSYTNYRCIAELCLVESNAFDRIASIREKI